MYPPVVLRRVLLQLPKLCLRTFQVGMAFLEICTTTEPGSVLQIPSQSHHLLPICFARYMMSPLSMARNLAVAANALYRVVSTGLKICPISGCSFMPNFPNFLFSTMSSVLSHTSSLFSLDMVIFKDVKLDASVLRMNASACFRSAS